MKAILMSIRPQHLVNILNGKKTIELRKKFPSDFRGWVYLYCTKGHGFLHNLHNGWMDGKQFLISHKELDYFPCINGKVVCRFWVENVEEITVCPPCYEQHSLFNNDEYLGELETSKIDLLEKACVNDEELAKYLYNEVSEELYEKFDAIHISKLEIFDKPKELDEFWADPIDFSIHTKAEAFAEGYHPIARAPQSWQYVFYPSEVEE